MLFHQWKKSSRSSFLYIVLALVVIHVWRKYIDVEIKEEKETTNLAKSFNQKKWMHPGPKIKITKFVSHSFLLFQLLLLCNFFSNVTKIWIIELRPLFTPWESATNETREAFYYETVQRLLRFGLNQLKTVHWTFCLTFKKYLNYLIILFFSCFTDEKKKKNWIRNFTLLVLEEETKSFHTNIIWRRILLFNVYIQILKH